MEEVKIICFDAEIADTKRAAQNAKRRLDYDERAALNLDVVIAQLDKTNDLLERMLDLLSREG